LIPQINGSKYRDRQVPAVLAARNNRRILSLSTFLVTAMAAMSAVNRRRCAGYKTAVRAMSGLGEPGMSYRQGPKPCKCTSNNRSMDSHLCRLHTQSIQPIQGASTSDTATVVPLTHQACCCAGQQAPCCLVPEYSAFFCPLMLSNVRWLPAKRAVQPPRQLCSAASEALSSTC
jgi:hypothetical protein